MRSENDQENNECDRFSEMTQIYDQIMLEKHEELFAGEMLAKNSSNINSLIPSKPEYETFNAVVPTI